MVIRISRESGSISVRQDRLRPRRRRPKGPNDIIPLSVRTSQSGTWGVVQRRSSIPTLAAELHRQRAASNSIDNPDAHCLPLGVMQLHTHGQPRKMVQTPGLIVIIYEANAGLRQIFTDGRPLPADAEPWWFGYSTGKWEGDTLVVESTKFRDLGWLDVEGSPLTETGKIIERFRRPDFGHLEIEVTIDDPKAYTKPWTVTVYQRLMPDTDLIEFICQETVRTVRICVSRAKRSAPRLCAPDPPSIHAVENRLADVLLQLPAGRQRERTRERVGLRERFRVIDGELDVQMTQVGPLIALGQMHRVAVWLAGESSHALSLKPTVSTPACRRPICRSINRTSFRARCRVRLRRPGRIAVAVSISFPQQRDHFGTLHDLIGQGIGAHRAVRQAKLSGSSLPLLLFSRRKSS